MRNDNSWAIDSEQAWIGSDDSEWADAFDTGLLDQHDFEENGFDRVDFDELDSEDLDADADADVDEFFDPNERRLASALREGLHPALVRCPQRQLVDALHDAMDSMSHAESFNFTKALSQIGRGAKEVASNPLVGQIARTALPIAAGAAGTFVGGPAGTALGTSIGSAVAKSLPSKGTGARPGAAPPPQSVTPAATGSIAATQGLVLTQQPDVLKALLALALGDRGASSVNGVPVGSMMSMLSNVFSKAAEDADELFYRTSTDDGDVWQRGEDFGGFNASYGEDFDGDSDDDRAQMLYSHLLAGENFDLQEAMGW